MSLPQPAFASRKAIWSWLLFDWACQPFFTLVVTFVFAPYAVSRLVSDPAEGQALWGYATAAAGLVLALLAPFLGSVADALGAKKPWIAASGVVLVAGCCALWFAAPGVPHAFLIAVVVFACATVAAEIMAAFNNAMMVHLVPAERLGRLSGTGWALGYAGGLVSLVIALGFLAANPATGLTYFGLSPLFGLDPVRFEGDRASGPFAALWFIIFVLPLFLFTPDVPAKAKSLSNALREGWTSLLSMVAEARRDPKLVRFLIANMIYQDGLAAIFAFGGIYGAGVFGWGALELGLFGILLTVTGTAGALIGGWLDDRVGPRAVILGSLVTLIVVCIGTASLGRETILFVIHTDAPVAQGGLYAGTAERVFLALGLLIGFVAGPLQSASRSLMARLSPPDATGRYFGLFTLSGKATSFLAPLSIALATDLTDTQAAAPVVLMVFFVVGIWGMLRLTKETS